MNKKKSVLIVGKNTIIANVIKTKSQGLPESHPYYDELKRFATQTKEVEALLGQVKGKVGLIFSDEPVFDLKEPIESNRV